MNKSAHLCKPSLGSTRVVGTGDKLSDASELWGGRREFVTLNLEAETKRGTNVRT